MIASCSLLSGPVGNIGQRTVIEMAREEYTFYGIERYEGRVEQIAFDALRDARRLDS